MIHDYLGLHPWRIAARAVVVGLVSGVLAIAFRALLEASLEFAHWVGPQVLHDRRVAVVWVLGAAVVVLIVNRILALVPESGGSGIPQVKGYLEGSLSLGTLRVIVGRSVAGSLLGAFGLSLGREGPSIHIGAAGGLMAARGMRSDPLTSDYLVSAGGAAGLAAAFSAPLSGLFFALEGLHRSFSRPLVLSAAASAFLAGGLASGVFGLTPILAFVEVPQLPVRDYPWMLLVGVGSGLVGVLMTKGFLAAQSLYGHLPLLWRLTTAMAIAMVVQVTVPGLMGGGEGLIRVAQEASVGLGVMCALGLAKALVTMSSFGSGVPGGIFMPILAVGALTGSFLACVLAQIGIVSTSIVPVAAVAAMAGALSGSVKSPLTAIMLTVEMVGSVHHLLPVALCAFTALGVSDLVRSPDVYGALLGRILTAHRIHAEQP